MNASVSVDEFIADDDDDPGAMSTRTSAPLAHT